MKKLEHAAIPKTVAESIVTSRYALPAMTVPYLIVAGLEMETVGHPISRVLLADGVGVVVFAAGDIRRRINKRRAARATGLDTNLDRTEEMPAILVPSQHPTTRILNEPPKVHRRGMEKYLPTLPIKVVPPEYHLPLKEVPLYDGAADIPPDPHLPLKVVPLYDQALDITPTEGPYDQDATASENNSGEEPEINHSRIIVDLTEYKERRGLITT